MYHLIRTYTQSYDKSEGIRELVGGDKLIRDLISENSEAYLVLSNDVLEGEHFLDLKDVYADIYQSNPTYSVNDWLAYIGNRTLPTKTGSIKIKQHKVRSMDAYLSGFKIDSSSGSTLRDTGDILDEDKPHLSITKYAQDFTNSHRSLLASVNGLLHLTDSDKDALYISGAGDSARLSGSNKVALYNFGNLGDMRCYPFSLCEITPKTGNDLFNGVTVTTPYSVKGKTVLLSIMGHLYYKGSNYRVLGDSSIFIEWSEINPYRNYFRNKDKIDLSLIDAVMNTEGGTNILNKEVFKSNKVIEAILHLNQSFIITIDNPSITFELERLEETGLPGKWLSYGDPYLPYLNSSGYLLNTSLINERRCHVVSTSVDNAYTPTFYEDTSNPDDSVLHTDASYHYQKIKKTSLYKLHIESSTLQVELM